MKQFKKILSIVLTLLLVIAPLSFTASASDYDEHWAAGNINEAKSRGWVTGYPDGSFQSNKIISRAEFSSMLWGALDIENKNTQNPYSDVSAHAWYYDAVIGLYHAGIASGYGNGIYAPDDKLTREMAFTMLAYAFNLTVGNEYAYQAFSDYSDVSSWAIAPVSAMKERGYVSGVGNKQLAPKSSMTRAQMATILIIVYDGETGNSSPADVEPSIPQDRMGSDYYEDWYSETAPEHPLIRNGKWLREDGLAAMYISGTSPDTSMMYLEFAVVPEEGTPAVRFPYTLALNMGGDSSWVMYKLEGVYISFFAEEDSPVIEVYADYKDLLAEMGYPDPSGIYILARPKG